MTCGDRDWTRHVEACEREDDRLAWLAECEERLPKAIILVASLAFVLGCLVAAWIGPAVWEALR